MTPEERRLREQIEAAVTKSAKAAAPVSNSFWVDETVWDSAAPYKVSRPQPNVQIKINADSFTNPKVTSQTMAQPPAKKYRASLLVETNDLDRGTVTTQRLLSVDLTADDFEGLVVAAHGHLDLVKDN